MNQYQARDLLHWSEEAIWTLEEGNISLLFDNDVAIQTTGKETIISTYAWDIHRTHALTPLLPRHHINGKRFSSNTFLDLLSHAVWDCKDVYGDDVDVNDKDLFETASLMISRIQTAAEKRIPVDMDVMAKSAYEITNHAYNSLSDRLEEWPVSLDAIDWVEAVNHPPIAEYRAKMYESGGRGLYNPDDFNVLVKKELAHSPALANNGVARLVRGGLVREDQVAQCVGSRGRATDITSDMFVDPILGGFATGMDCLKDMAMESRSASLSLYFQKEPMKKSEYFNRNIQLSAATLQRLHHVDCQSRHYIPMTINNTKTLRDMNGIAYLDETTGTERLIRKNLRELVGKTIKIRSVLTCQHPDRGGVCVRCFGEIGYSIPLHTNIGHVSSSEMQSKVGQLLLSNKHYLASAILAALQIVEHDRLYIQGGREESHLYMTDIFRDRPYKLVIDGKEAINFGDIRDVPNPDTLSPFRVSELTQINFLYESADGFETSTYIDCNIGNRNASLSREFLRYAKRVGWKTSDEGHYIVDMSQWDIEEALLELPMKHFSTLDYMVGIEKFIKGGEAKEKGATMINQPSLEAALVGLHELVSLKLDVNFSYLQVILLSAMVQSRRDRDYRLPMPRYSGEPAHYRRLMQLRSIATMMAFQEQKDALYGIESYIITKRPDHPFDQLVFG